MQNITLIYSPALYKIVQLLLSDPFMSSELSNFWHASTWLDWVVVLILSILLAWLENLFPASTVPVFFWNFLLYIYRG